MCQLLIDAGCDACPMTRLCAPEAAAARYASPFAHWDRRASVRSVPLRRVELPTSPAAEWFPRAYAPILGHPLVAGLGEKAHRAILLQHLYGYMDFTVTLELNVVNPAVLEVIMGTSPVTLPPAMIRDAYRVYVDEGWHALFSAELVHQVHALTGIAPLPEHDGAPRLRDRLANLQACAVDPAQASLIRLFFVIVSECLITAVLRQDTPDEAVPEAITDTIRDHWQDETRHHAFFRDVLYAAWPQLGAPDQNLISFLFPRMIDVFLWPDLKGRITELVSVGMSYQNAVRAVRETYTDEMLEARKARAAQRLHGYARELGVMRG